MKCQALFSRKKNVFSLFCLYRLLKVKVIFYLEELILYKINHTADSIWSLFVVFFFFQKNKTFHLNKQPRRQFI